MKKLELVFTAILVPFDYLVLLLSGTLAYFLRFESFVTEIRPVVFEMKYSDFLNVLALASLAWIIVFAFSGLYTIERRGILKNITKIIIACSAATLLIVVAFFFNFQLFNSRLIILTGWILSIIFISIDRILIHYIKKIFYKKGLGVRKVVIIGEGNNANEIVNEFKRRPTFGFKILMHFKSFNYDELKLFMGHNKVDDLILADTNLSESEKNNIINLCVENNLTYKYAASLLETKISNFRFNTIAGIPVIEVKHTRLDGWGRIIKRVFDFIFALGIFIILSPFLLIIGLIVIFTSSGPMIVKLERIGADGKRFKLYKFRSMIKDAHKMKKELIDFNERADGPLFKMQADPRITKFGKFIRKYSLDELLQLLNVIFGSMSLVGPRPHEPQEVAKYQVSDKKLLAIKPGITGMAQVSGRSDLSWQEEVRLDTYYVENWSLSLDIQILLKTPRAVLGKRQAV